MFDLGASADGDAVWVNGGRYGDSVVKGHAFLAL